MGLQEDLKSEIGQIFTNRWAERAGTVVPDDNALKLGNDAVNLDATVLYADLVDSTGLVSSKLATLAAAVYKTYLACASRLIKAEGGEITAFDGDRVMAVFLGSAKNTSAVRCAFKINWAVQNLLNPGLRSVYQDVNYTVRHVVGIDSSQLLVARAGIRGANDLVWIGKAANYAAKLCSIRDASTRTWITQDVFNSMLSEVKVSRDGRAMWEMRTWTAMSNVPVYGSTWWWIV